MANVLPSKRTINSSQQMWRLLLCIHFVCLVFCIGIAIFVLTTTQTNLEAIPPHTEPCPETRLPETQTTKTITPVETPIPTRPHRAKPDNVGDYVTFGNGLLDGRGIGNQLFCFAVVVFVADLTGRQTCRVSTTKPLGLDNLFDLNVIEFDDIRPTYDYRQMNSSQKYDMGVEEVSSPYHPHTKTRSLVMYGFYQSWKYVHTVDRRLRQQHLRFLPDLVKFVEEFYRRNIPPSWTRSYTRVGIHVRRGDILSKSNVVYGYTTPNATYFRRAMEYFTTRYARVQFIVCSEDTAWMKDQIVQGSFSNTTVNITYAVWTTKEEDFAILSHCDHVIMSTGTFGWWAGWIAKGTTIFFKHFPTKGSELAQWFIFEDYFPPNWIGLE